MKKRILLTACMVVGLAVLMVLAIYLLRRREDPEVLLGWLKKGKGEREEVLMRLNMARGDVTTPMILAFQDMGNPSAFRADLLELMFKKNLRMADPQIETVFVAAIKDTSTLVRKKAVSCYALYAESRLKPLLIPFVNDPDPEVREIVCNALTTDKELWDKMNTREREDVIERAFRQKSRETDSMLMFLNRSLIGREAAELCKEGLNAFQRSEPDKGDSLFKRAIALDTTNPRPPMMLATYYAQNRDNLRAERAARAGGALAEVPRLAVAPVIDGDPTDPAWSQGCLISHLYIGTRWACKAATGKAHLRMGHKGGRLYLAVIIFEEDLDKLKITQTKNGAKVFVDDCVEMVLNPAHEQRSYFKFIVNAGGYVYQRYSSKRDVSYKYESGAKIFKDRGYWALEFSVSGKDLENHPVQPGTLWNFSVVVGRAGARSERGLFWHEFEDDIQPLALFK